MHKRRFSPCLAALDPRISLSGTGTTATVTSIAPLTAAQASPTDNVINWYMPGLPPVDKYDPCVTPIPWNMMPTI